MKQNLRNIAIVAHVDHGKTTMVDELLKQSGVYQAHETATVRVMDSGELEKERGITITAKNCAIQWKDTKINLLDTPGHADFGGEVERSLMMVDGILLLVDASEGPLPQTRFVLTKALERRLKIAVCINKVDRPDERIEEVKHEIENLFLELVTMLDIHDYDLDIPILYASGRAGFAGHTPDIRSGTMHPMLDFIVEFFPSPKILEGEGLQLLVSNLGYSNYLGVMMVGRIQRGEIFMNKQALWVGKDGKPKPFKVTSIQMYEGLKQTTVDSASAGEIVIVSGFPDAQIGDTICNTDKADPLPRIEVEPPTVSVQVSVSTSPLSGREGEYLTSRRLEEFLQDATRKNVALKYEQTEDPKVFTLKGRGELQLAIVFEEIRRAGYELMVSRPNVLFKEDESGNKLEPFERVVLDVPSDSTGPVTEKLANRKAKMESMMPLGDTRTRMEFTVPSRGLIGYRSVFLTDTKGQGLMSSYFIGYEPFVGKMLGRTNGALISDRQGKTTPYALFNLLSSGKQFVKPGEDVYEGMVVGESTRNNDLNLNVVREKHLTSVRTAGKDENIILPPIPERTLDWALAWIDEDEWVEVTPKNIRIRKKELAVNKRTVMR
ncbi:MAG: translational GTPase TypA [Bacteriovoracaceae bacterium]